MKNLTLCLFFFSLINFVHAQDDVDDIQYFDKLWIKVPNKERAAYYRTIVETDETILVREYLISGQLQMEAMYSSVKPSMIRDGITVLYYENGKVREHSNYKDDKPAGPSKTFYETGAPKGDFVYEDDKKIFNQIWSEDGTPLIKDGNAFIKNTDEETGFIYHKVIENSLLTSTYYTTVGSADTVYTPGECQPTYVGGYDQMVSDIRANMTYPRSARRKGIQGNVFVQFTVTKNGDISECHIYEGIDPECDTVALRAVKSLKKWNPGFEDGRPVSVRFILPIKFKLR